MFRRIEERFGDGYLESAINILWSGSQPEHVQPHGDNSHQITLAVGHKQPGDQSSEPPSSASKVAERVSYSSEISSNSSEDGDQSCRVSGQTPGDAGSEPLEEPDKEGKVWRGSELTLECVKVAEQLGRLVPPATQCTADLRAIGKRNMENTVVCKCTQSKSI
jgi:hypothetical protein